MIGKDSYVGSVGPQNMFGSVALKSFGTEAFLTFSKSIFQLNKQGRMWQRFPPSVWMSSKVGKRMML